MRLGKVVRNRIKLCRIAAAAVVCGLAGCVQSGERGFHLIAASRFYEPDIPLPTGFGKVESLSEERFTGQKRMYLVHAYEGRGEPYSVSNFYTEQMPMYEWSKVSAGSLNGVYSLKFTKGQEACAIEIKDVGWGRARVRVVVNQESNRGDAASGTRKTQ
jgi:hypothetical protein